MYKRIDKGQIIKKENAREVLGDGLFFELKEIGDSTMLKHGFFLRFFERRNQYRYLLKKKTQGKNQMLRELSTCAIRKLNG